MYWTNCDLIIFFWVGIWVRGAPPYPLLVVKGLRIWMVLQMRLQKHSRCGTINIPPCSKAVNFTVTSPYEQTFLETDVKEQTSKLIILIKTNFIKCSYTPIAECLAFELSLLILRLRSIAAGIRTFILLLAGRKL